MRAINNFYLSQETPNKGATLALKIIIISFLICSFQSLAQNYSDYYQGINKAKLSLIEDDLQTSLTYYFETFEKFEFVFARDCFNALEVSSSLGDLKMIDYFLKRCIKQGIEFEYLEQDSALYNYKQTVFWTETLLAKDSLRLVYENSINWEVRSEITEMFTEDQRIRDLATKNRFNIFRIKKLNKQFEEIDRKLIIRIIEITKEYGFPGEKLIGIDNNSMHPKIHTDRLTAGMPIIIFLHHYGQPNKSNNHILINEIRSGYLSNEHYATISDFQHTFGKEKFGKTPSYSLMFSRKLDVELIDKNRKEINLLTVIKTDELKRKKLITPKYYLY